MRRIEILTVVLGVFITFFAVHIQNADHDQLEIERIVFELEQAVSMGNKETWQKFMAEDGILINRDGREYHKQDLLNEIEPKSPGIILDIRPIQMKTYLQKNSAFVYFIADEHLSIHSQIVDTRYPSVMYFEKRARRWQMVFFSYFEQPVDPPAVKVDMDYLASFTGVYSISEEMKIEVSATDSTLLYRKPGSADTGTVLYPIDQHGHFFRPGTETEFIFTQDQSHHPVIRQRRNWIDLIWKQE